MAKTQDRLKGERWAVMGQCIVFLKDSGGLAVLSQYSVFVFGVTWPSQVDDNHF